MTQNKTRELVRAPIQQIKKEASTKLPLRKSDRRRSRSGGPRLCADRSRAETRELVRAPSTDNKKGSFYEASFKKER